MSEKDALQMVCMEPLLFAFQAPRTIAQTLAEYEEHLRTERRQPQRRVRVTLASLERLLEPIEAPLVSLTREVAQALLLHEEDKPELIADGSLPVRCLAHERARRFFRWATLRGYVSSNPFDGISVPLVEEQPTEWLA